MARKWVANLDIYRKVPGDLLEGSRRGSLISIGALIVIFTLFVLETKEFFTTSLQTDLQLDPNHEKKVKVNFNITMLDLRCEYATIDVVSILGKEQNVSQNVHKWTVDEDGIQQQYLHRNMMQHDVELGDSNIKESLEQMTARKNKEDAVYLDEDTFEWALDEYTFVFVDFFASWCSHCQVLAPTYETLAEIMLDAAREQLDKMERPEDRDSYTDEEYEDALKVHMPVLIGKVDCVLHKNLCWDEQITGYPTLRLFVNGEAYEGGDYWGHRTILGMVHFLQFAEEKHKDDYKERGLANSGALERRMNVTEEERTWAEAMERTRHNMQAKWNPEDHPGCMISGYLWMDRAPGHFYIEARSTFQNLVPHMTNVSHEINHLSFGDSALSGYYKRKENMVFPANYDESLTPMDGNVYITHELHQAHHHYIKLVSTNLFSYQVLQSSQLAYYTEDKVPEAKFVIDLSPISVTYRSKTRRWYEYITSLMAIIGGTFTVVGMLEASMRVASQRLHSPRKKPPRPHGHSN